MSGTEIIEATASERPVLVRQLDQQASVVERIATLALDPAVSVEKMQALIDMRDRLEATAARKAFDLAISLAKAEIPTIVKDKHVGFESKSGGAKTDYDHETLAQIARTVDPILGRYGLSYRYRTEQAQGGVTVTCIVSHRDGHSEPTTLSSPVDASGNKNPIQAIGSAVTYLQRYTLKAALGLSAGGREDDGRASGVAGSLTADQYRELNNLMVAAGADEKFLRVYGVEDLHDLPGAMYGPAKALLDQRAKARANA